MGVAVSGWQPIETAPRDRDGAIWVGAAVGNNGMWGMEPVWRMKKGWTNIYSHEPIDWQPTHWQPLPPPPEA